ncbi:MAG: two-component regulator propeller domain-containing protein [Bacteroidota bacterium]|nr:two-component regulator propeller domain-containing protein [Bacteroidota bacterium]
MDKSGNLWIGTSIGASKYDGQSFTHFSNKNGLINNDINSILEDRLGNLWFGSTEEITKFNGRSFTNYYQKGELGYNDIRTIMEDRSGNLWFGTAGGILKFDGRSFKHIAGDEESGTYTIHCIKEDKSGNVWVALYGGGILKFDGQNITHLTEKDGLISNFVASIQEDKSGNCWFGTRFGLSKIPAAKAGIFSKKVKSSKTLYENNVLFKNYGFTDNFTGIGNTSNILLESKENRLWVGTNAGVTIVNPAKELMDTIPPTIQITAIKLFNENIDWLELKQKEDSSFLLGNGIWVSNFNFTKLSNWYNLPIDLSLTHKNNFITFDFVGITMSQSQNVKYQYQLEGLDKNQSAVTKQPSASYGNLPPGTYTFKVKAMNSEGYWSNESKYTFSIRPPWWKTWWFRSLAIIALSGFIFFIGRFIYVSQLRKQRIALEKQLAVQYEHQRISSDLHDDIGSTLSSINIYAGLARKQTNKDVHLDAITQNISEVVNKLDDMVWSINPKYDSFTSMINRLQSYAKPICHAKGIRFEVVNDLPETEIRFSTDIKQGIYLTAKELVNNSIKHSGCKKIKVEFSRQQNMLHFSVIDD